VSVPAPLADIDNWLAAGKPIIVEVDYSPDPGVQNHWIVLCGKQGDDYLIRDPWKSAKGEQTLKQRYSFAGDVSQIINNVIFLDGTPVPGAITGALPKATPAAAPPPKPATPASAASAATSESVSSISELTLKSVLSGSPCATSSLRLRTTCPARMICMTALSSAPTIGVTDSLGSPPARRCAALR